MSNRIGKHKTSSTDLRILQECEKEAFVNKSLPLMIGMGVGTHYLVKIGKLTANPKWGSLVKVSFAALCGNILGRLLHIGTVKEKLKAEPNSLLGRELRRIEGSPLLEPTDLEVIDILRSETQGRGEASRESGSLDHGYDEMRRLHRENPAAVAPSVSERMNKPVRDSIQGSFDDIPPEERPINKRMPVPKRNKYGDIIDD